MNIKTIAACLIMIISLTGKAAEAPLHGALVYVAANSIYDYDMEMRKADLLYEFPYGTMIGSLSVVDDDRVLFYVYPTENDIIEFNLKTHTKKKIRKGSHPVYISEHENIFFYDRPEGTGRLGLYVAKLDDPVGSLREVDEGPYVLPQQVTQVSHDEVVFLSGRDSNSQNLWKYNIVTEKLDRLPIENCRPQVWRTATNELLCLDLSTGRRFFSDLAGHKGEDYLADDLVPILYIPSCDVLVAGRARFQMSRGELWDFIVYDFDANKESLLLKGGAGPLGSAAWFKKVSLRSE